MMNKTTFQTIQKNFEGHIAGLDALRGIAVIWVVWHNCTGAFELDGLLEKILAFITNCGWLGVQLFFVLSGFLITGLLLDAKGTANQMRNFYIRRTVRIFPVYYATLIFCFLVLPLLNVELPALADSQKMQVWFWLYLNNWATAPHSPGIFPHLWSLAVEEQFYLLWPFLALGLNRSQLVYTCITLIISAIIFKCIKWNCYSIWDFFKKTTTN